MRKWPLVLGAFLALAGVAAAGWSQWVKGTAVIRIDPSRTYQTMNGWEVTPRLWEMNKQENRFDGSWRAYRDEIFGGLVNELGIDRIRLEVRSGVENRIDRWTEFEQGKISYKEYSKVAYENINDNDDPRRMDPNGFQFGSVDFYVEQVLLPLRQLVEARGEKLFVNLCYVDFGGQSIEHAGEPEEYAELIAATFQHLNAKYGIVPDALEIILEPDNGPLWTGEAIGHAIVKASARLRAAGYSPQIIAPSTSKAHNAPGYFDDLIKVPGALEALSTVAYHLYDSPRKEYFSPLPKIRERAEKYGLTTAMLEYLYAGADDLHADLKIAHVSAWQLWGLATKNSAPAGFDRSYYYEVNFTDPSLPKVQMTPASRSLAQYFHFVRRGAVRIEATSTHSVQDPVAFRNVDGGHVVIVKADRGGDLSIEGLPAGAYRERYTTATENGVDRPLGTIRSNEALQVHLPAPGVLTVYRESGSGPIGFAPPIIQ